MSSRTAKLSSKYLQPIPMENTTISTSAIPQPWRKFRLAGLQSSKVLVAKSDDRLVDYPQGQVYADQFSASQKVIYSNRGAVGMYEKSYYEDQYFVFEPGSGQFQGYFRLRNN
ncbi:hypothetical protein BJX68DRAFT_270326 [Aspergillus pseudodeflectus]|uniref:Uncharacterized protein n=1 Tax=Aspergillus pseudodeflectus TaxID=176178 RepID=A0ABR4JVP3_9EURO